MSNVKAIQAVALTLGMASSAALLAACHWPSNRPPPQPASKTAPAARATPTSGPAGALWENPSKGVKLTYPAAWQPCKSPDYVLMLLPIGAMGDDRRITLDVPDLPPHLPFMLQMSRIQHDYLQDLKKSHPDLQVQDAADATVPNSTARLVRSIWHQDKQAYHDIVLLIVHANAVYILDAQTDAPHLAGTRGAFESIRSSLQWTGR